MPYYGLQVGVPDVTCLVYEATDGGPVEDCRCCCLTNLGTFSPVSPFTVHPSKPDINVCRDCTWPPPEVGEKHNCWARQNFTRSPGLV